MAQASKKKRSISRVKNAARKKMRQARDVVQAIAQQASVDRQRMAQAEYTLLVILNQVGTVTVNTSELEAFSNIATQFGYAVKPAPDTPKDEKPAYFSISLEKREDVQLQPTSKPAGGVTITKVEDETEGSGENDISGDILKGTVADELVDAAVEAAAAEAGQ